MCIRDSTEEVRSVRVTEAVSAIATNLDVRADMRRRQRALIAEGLAACLLYTSRCV